MVLGAPDKVNIPCLMHDKKKMVYTAGIQTERAVARTFYLNARSIKALPARSMPARFL